MCKGKKTKKQMYFMLLLNFIQRGDSQFEIWPYPIFHTEVYFIHLPAMNLAGFWTWQEHAFHPSSTHYIRHAPPSGRPLDHFSYEESTVKFKKKHHNIASNPPACWANRTSLTRCRGFRLRLTSKCGLLQKLESQFYICKYHWRKCRG